MPEEKNKYSDSRPQVSSQQQFRQRYIVRRLREVGFFTHEEIEEEWNKYNREHNDGPPVRINRDSVIKDTEYLNLVLDKNIRSTKERDSKGRLQWVDLWERKLTSKSARDTTNKKSKEKIATIATSLILGSIRPEKAFPEMENYGWTGVDTLSVDAKESILKKKKIFYYTYERNSLTPESNFTSDPLKTASPSVFLRICAERERWDIFDRLVRFFMRRDRRILLDAGTTTEKVAQSLQSIKIPLRRELVKAFQENEFIDVSKKVLEKELEFELPLLENLELCTNSRSIFYCLGEPHVDTRVIICGGWQRERSEAIAGEIARRFLAVADLHFGLGIVGATAVNLLRKEIGSDIPSDARMKQDFLERSELKIVVADRSKLLIGDYAAYHRVSGIERGTVDILIVDSRPGPNTNEALLLNNLEKNEGLLVLTHEDVFPKS